MPAAQTDTHPDDGWPIIPFETPDGLEDWLEANHDGDTGIWVKFAKKSSGIKSVTMFEAVEVALCFGWIDAKQQGVDDDWYILRFQPRRAKSNWSATNKERVARLTAEGRMRPSGQAQIDAAKADDRWDAN